MKHRSSEHTHDTEMPIRSLLTKAVEDSPFGVTLADARAPDMPLIYANDAFMEMTGYPFHEIVGRNCRFLQGPDTDPASVDIVRQAIRRREAATTLLLNYRQDGSIFYNRFQISPVFDDHGDLRAFLGIQVMMEDEAERLALIKCTQAV